MGERALNLGSKLTESPAELEQPRDALRCASGQTLADPLRKAIALVSLLLTDGASGRAREAIFKLTVLLFSTKLKQLF